MHTEKGVGAIYIMRDRQKDILVRPLWVSVIEFPGDGPIIEKQVSTGDQTLEMIINDFIVWILFTDIVDCFNNCMLWLLDCSNPPQPCYAMFDGGVLMVYKGFVTLKEELQNFNSFLYFSSLENQRGL